MSPFLNESLSELLHSCWLIWWEEMAFCSIYHAWFMGFKTLNLCGQTNRTNVARWRYWVSSIPVPLFSSNFHLDDVQLVGLRKIQWKFDDSTNKILLSVQMSMKANCYSRFSQEFLSLCFCCKGITALLTVYGDEYLILCSNLNFTILIISNMNEILNGKNCSLANLE